MLKNYLLREHLAEADDNTQTTAVMMANREMALERYFEEHNVPEEQATAIREDQNMQIFLRLGEIDLIRKIFHDQGVEFNDRGRARVHECVFSFIDDISIGI